MCPCQDLNTRVGLSQGSATLSSRLPPTVSPFLGRCPGWQASTVSLHKMDSEHIFHCSHLLSHRLRFLCCWLYIYPIWILIIARTRVCSWQSTSTSSLFSLSSEWKHHQGPGFTIYLLHGKEWLEQIWVYNMWISTYSQKLKKK